MVEHVKSDEDDPAGASRTSDPGIKARAGRMFGAGKRQVKESAVVGFRAVLPLLEAYTAQRAAELEGGTERSRTSLNRGEQAVLKAGSKKMFLQMVEIASRTHPVFPDAPVFRPIDGEGKEQAPHLMHLLALGAAARSLLARKDEDDDEQSPPPEGGGEEPTVVIPPEQTVLFMPVAPGEYAMRSGPMAPREIRRMAMRQRVYTPPQAARLMSPANAREAVVGPAGGAQARRAMGVQRGQRQMQQQQGQAWSSEQTAVVPVTKTRGCGCGAAAAKSCCAGSCATRQFSPARYDEDGDCASMLDISCDTQWRVRESFKLALCDLLRCVASQVCDEDGHFVEEPELGECLQTFVCSLLGTLPDAICPPQQRCCPAPEQGGCGPDDDCNFAVGE